MPKATNGGECEGGACSIGCRCDDPVPGGGEHGDQCQECGKLILGAIIDGEVHPGYTSLGNGEAFFEDREYWRLNSGDRGTIVNDGGDGYFRTFAEAEVVVPHDSDKARRLGTEPLSFDHAVFPDGSVKLVVLNRTIDALPDGPKFPAESGHSPT